MSKFRNRLMKRVMAMVLSAAMIMSGVPSSGTTAYAAEYSDIVSEDSADEAKESEYKESENKEETPDASESEKPDTGTSKTEGPEVETSKTEQSKTEQPSVEASKTEQSKTEQPSVEASKTEQSSVEASKTEQSSVEASKTEQSSVEESSDSETSEPESSVTLASGSIGDLSGGLKPDKEYGDDIIKFTVLEEMKPKNKTAEVEGTKYTFYVAGENDPKSADNKSISDTNLIPATGSAFKITAVKDAKITFVLNEASTKTYYFVKSDGELIDSANVLKTDEYTFKMLKGNTYYFCVAGSKVAVYDIKWIERDLEDEANRPDWSTFAKPVVKAALDSTDKSKVNVTVDTIIGSKGADKIEVFMYDEDGEVAGSAASVRETDKPTELAFYPDATGNYTFQAVISRTGEEQIIESEMTAPLFYQVPLTVPVFKIATNLGDGRIMLKWSAVAETEKYVVEYDGQKVESTTSGVIVEGLTVGKEYSFTVYAARGDEKTEKSKALKCTATQDLEFTWLETNYGNGMKAGGVKFNDKTKDGVRLWTDASATKSTGKIVPASYDGLGFYYTAIDPNLYNFTFTAKAHINSWTYSNGQEGFGIMAADSVPEVGQSPTAFWNNSYQAVASKIGYKWDGESITTDGTGTSIDMAIGIGSTAKTGVTPSDAKAIAVGEATAPLRYTAEQTSIDKTYATYGKGEYNLVGNCTNSKGGDIQYVNFELQIQKNNTGYFVSYTKLDDDGNYILDSDGNKITETAKYYDTSALSVLEDDIVYIGAFAARDVDVTFSDMSIILTDPATDPDPEPQPPKYVNLSTNMMSGSIANSSDYTFMFSSNWNGQLVIKDSMGGIITKHTEIVDGKEVELDYYDVIGTLDPDKSVLLDGDDNRNTKVYIEKKNILQVGKNVFTVEYTPDKDWTPEVDKETGRKLVELKNSNKTIFTHTVEYKKYGEQGETIYVSQSGKASNTGTKASPLDIYTAVKYAQPGQTILLAGGRYSLTSTLQIPRGISGEPDVVDGKETYNKYIKMMAEDPENRPVLDFNSMVAAMVTVGDYWYFKNFDVIRCKDGEKGIQVSGSYCVFDRVDTYKNGSTGLQICRAANSDTYKDWPHDNLILNCNSYLNADHGYEDADGFAAKLTSGSNNVFDGCIAAYNADDGWDLFAKAQTGSIGAVLVKNCIAYRNGYVLYDENGNLSETGVLTDGGNGNGFKMGGDGLAAGSKDDPDYGKDPSANIPNSGHKLYNSLTFYNKSKGIDSNSAPNIKAYNSISFNNGASNISLAPKDWNTQTDYELKNVISFRDGTSGADAITTKGDQNMNKVDNDSTYKWNDTQKAAVNKSGDKITKDNFVSLTYDNLDRIDKSYWRNADGSINMHGFLQLKEGVTTDGETVPSIGGTPSNDPIIGEDTDGSITGGSADSDVSGDTGDDYPDDWNTTKEQYYGKIWAAEIKYLDNDATVKEEIRYTGKKVEPAVYVHFSSDAARLVKGEDYKLKYNNNVNAGTATVDIIGINNFKGFQETVTFEILPIKLTDNSVSIPRSVAVAEGKDPKKEIKPTWQGKALKEGKEYEIDTTDPNKYLIKAIGTNFANEKDEETGEDKPVEVAIYYKSDDQLMSKAKVTITTPAKDLIYTSKPIIPECDVTLNGNPLVPIQDYTVECANNVEIGKATLTVIGNGTTYFGSRSITFSIKGGSLNSAAKAFYTRGENKDQELPANLGEVTFNGDPASCTIPENTFEVKVGDNVLRQNIDYKVIQSAKKAGSAKLTIQGINNYKGALTYKYTIVPYTLSNEILDEETGDKDFKLTRVEKLEYNPNGAKYVLGQNFQMALGINNIDAENYWLTYKNNKAVTRETTLDKDKPIVVVHGKNLLKGTITLNFTIDEACMTDNPDFAVTGNNIITNGNPLKYADFKKINVIVTQSENGKPRKLAPNRDYLKNDIEYYIDDGDYKFDATKDILIDINKSGEVTETDKFTKDGYATIFIRAKADESENNKSSYTGECVGMIRAAMWDIGKAKALNLKPRIFGKNYEKGNGNSVPMVFDTINAPMNQFIEISYKVKSETDYLNCVDYVGKYTYDSTVYDSHGFAVMPNSYKRNTKVGTASFTVVGTGKYAGTLKVRFRIINRTTAEKEAAKNGITSWDEISEI